jgi:hypothetical protein
MTWRFFFDFSARRIPNGRPRSRVQFNLKKKEKVEIPAKTKLPSVSNKYRHCPADQRK